MEFGVIAGLAQAAPNQLGLYPLVESREVLQASLLPDFFDEMGEDLKYAIHFPPFNNQYVAYSLQ
jgi:hypothetical protein